MKTTYLYQKFICIFLACLMLVIGIQAAGTHRDSFFAFSEGEKQRMEIGKNQKEIEPICHILNQYNDSYEEILDKANQLKNKKNYRDQYMICPDSILHTNLFFAFEKADIRLWQPSRLTDAFTILYIHCQDGLKRTIPLF